MPSSMTHTYFGIDVYKKLKKNTQAKLGDSLECFKLFCQGSDPFMFYHFLIGKKAKEVAKIQSMMHKSKTRDFFLAIVNYIYNNKLINNSEVMAYLYGYICHYYLDLYTHPFIYYKSGVFKWNDKCTYKYNGLHQKIEYGIDLYFIKEREEIKSNKFKIYKGIFDVKSLSCDLKDIINETIGKVYGIDNSSVIYEKAIWYMVNFFRLANYDPSGLKLSLYKLIDKISPKGFINVSELSFYNEYSDVEISKWLNLNNDIWYCPWDNSKGYKSSFLELYDLAMRKAIMTIEEVTEMLENNKLNDKRLKILFNNLSFATGIDCEKEVEYKYFEV